jgi:isopentenyl phosphate kinase
MKKLILVKLGGSVITDKKVPYKASFKAIENLAAQLKKTNSPLIVAHGSGSFGHTSASIYGGSKGYKSLKGIAKVSFDAMEINRIVMDIFIKQGLPAVSFRPMSLVVAKNGKLEDSFFQPVEIALKQGVIPVFYGDVVWDLGWKSTIYSGETILDLISEYLQNKGYKINKIIEVIKSDGMLDDSKQTIPFIDKNAWPQLKKYVFKTKEKDVTGGMVHKVEKALGTASLGIPTLIVNGERKNELINALFDKPTKGTLIK